MSDVDYYKLCEQKQTEYDRLAKQTLLVKLEMATPFSTIDFIRLDGLLAYFSLRDLFQDEFYNLSGQTHDPVIDAPLPLEKCHNDNRQWWWACSFGVNSIYREQVARWKKRWDDEYDDLVRFPEKKKPRVNHKAGFFKAFDMPLVLKNAREILFCCVGNAAEIERLLRPCKFIGKKRSQGYGRIRRISITETTQDWSCRTEQDKPTRAIPVGPTDWNTMIKHAGGKFSYIAYKPPYWHPHNHAWCYSLKG